MSATPRIVLLEFNELTPHLLDKFMAQGHLPNFQRFRGDAHVYLTDAQAEPPELEPWVQWVTVHTGLTHTEHGLTRLNQGHMLEAPRVWDLYSRAGRTVWVCGSMNVAYDANLRGAVVPDPWCTQVPPVPQDLGLYFRFVQQNVLEYSNSNMPLTRADYVRFVAFMTRHGLSYETAASILRQLTSERDGRNRWRRAVLLDQLQYDLFASYYRRLEPAFSTFFLNSTAHYQHSYWRAMQPELFAVEDGDREDHESAILFGYQKMDALLGRFMTLAGEDTTLVFCTALSQQPCLKYEDQGGASFYRPTDVTRLGQFAGITAAFRSAPVMTHQYHFDFATERDAADADAKLRALTVDGTPVLQIERTGTRIFAGCDIYRPIASDAKLSSRMTGAATGFFDVFYMLETMKSGMHHPDGMLWIRTPARLHSEHPARVPLTVVAPTLLALGGLPKPSGMRSEPLDIPRAGGGSRSRAAKVGYEPQEASVREHARTA
jgi:hypothetical protein